MTSREVLFRSLEQYGWAVSDDIVPRALQESLMLRSQELWQAGRFHGAHIGRQENDAANADIRGDSIYWLDRAQTDSSHPDFFAWAAELRQELNQRYFLGLRSDEFHFARYAPGSSYKRHLDQHRSSQRRKISLVLYLNREWTPEDGGELCLYSADDSSGRSTPELKRILPAPGRLVIFRSELIPHEVLPCRQTRWSLSGWFRTDSEFE